MASREVLEAETRRVEIRPEHWRPVAPAALTAEAAAGSPHSLLAARRPLVVTSFVGRNPAAVEGFRALCATRDRRAGIGPQLHELPDDRPVYLGCQWNEPRQNAALAEADRILVIDSDVPWIPTVSRPRAGRAHRALDPDPLKPHMPLWYLPAEASFRADAAAAIRQILEAARRCRAQHDARIAERRARFARPRGTRARTRRARTAARRRHHARTPDRRRSRGRRRGCHRDGRSGHELSRRHAAFAAHAASDVLHERRRLARVDRRSRGRRELARPDALVVALNGDGSYLFSQPATVHWMARRYATPFLQVVYNNGGWKAPRVGRSRCTRTAPRAAPRMSTRGLRPSPTMPVSLRRRAERARSRSRDPTKSSPRCKSRSAAVARRAALRRHRCAARGALIACGASLQRGRTRARRWSGSTASFPLASAAGRR